MSQLLPERRPPGERERWEPLGELEQMSERMRRMLDQTFGRFGWPSTLTEPAAWAPLADIEETDDAYMLEVELPGVRREDVDIELIGNELAITGQVEEQQRQGTVRRRTRRTGRFEYRVGLPDPVDPDKVEANLRDGVLTVRVAKSQRAERRRIEIGS